MINFPIDLFKSPGPHNGGGTKTFDCCRAESFEEASKKLLEGWVVNLHALLNGKEQPTAEEFFQFDDVLTDAEIEEIDQVAAQVQEDVQEEFESSLLPDLNLLGREELLLIAQDLGLEVPKGIHQKSIVELIEKARGE